MDLGNLHYKLSPVVKELVENAVDACRLQLLEEIKGLQSSISELMSVRLSRVWSSDMSVRYMDGITDSVSLELAWG